MINGFAQKGLRNECCECVAQMVQNSIEPDDITFAALLSACVADKAIETATQIIVCLTRNGRKLDANVGAVFIKGLVRAKNLEKALVFYEGLKQQEGMKLDLVTYSMLIKG